MKSASLLLSGFRMNIDSPVADLIAAVNLHSPVHSAVRQENRVMLNLLLRSGASANFRDLSKRTALHYVAMNLKSSMGLSMAYDLLMEGADPNLQDEYGETPLNLAARSGNKHIFEFLLAADADVSLRNNEGYAALHCLATNTNSLVDVETMLEKLLSRGADINARVANGETALHLSANCNNARFFKLCLKFGADVNLKSHDQLTPLHCLILHTKAAVATELAVESLLHNADVNLPDGHGNTPLHLAAKIDSDKHELVELFLKHGAESRRNDDGLTPLMHEILAGNVRMIQCLIDHGVDVDEPIDDERTPLRWACELGNRHVIKCLLKNGADPNRLDTNGFTIFMNLLLQRVPHASSDVINLFLKHGADVNWVAPGGKNILSFLLDQTQWTAILQHVARLRTLGFPVNSSLTSTIMESEKFKSYYTAYCAECAEEFLEAKNTQLDGCWVTMSDILTVSPRQMVQFSRNKELVRDFQRTDLKRKFPIYRGMMRKKMSKGISSRKLRDRAAITVGKLCPALSSRHLVIHRVLDYFNDRDMSNICKCKFE